MKTRSVILYSLCALACAALSVSAVRAETITKYFHVISGTGFFVSNDGYVITNAHVVKGCTRVMLKGPQFSETEAEVRAVDVTHDLALIYTPQKPKDFATLRNDINSLQIGEKTFVIGYPGNSAISGQYQTANAAVVNMTGPREHPEWLQISDVVREGNSGGPLLDLSGNVVGVVVAKMEQQYKVYQTNAAGGPPKLIQSSDTRTGAAINLTTVQDFLHAQHVYSHGSYSSYPLSDARLEEKAKDFLVNVQCRTPISTAEATQSQNGHVIQVQ